METRADHPEYAVPEAEYLRLLGYPRDQPPGERARELMAWARDWFARHGRPWVYRREAALQHTAGEALLLDGVEFRSRRLQAHFRQHHVRGTVLVAVSAGGECEEHARQLWTQDRPDEYFFLEIFGSAVVEDLVARTSGRICIAAGRQDLMAVPHYSPGYTGWDVADQNKLFDLIAQGRSRPFPGPLEVLPSGMLRPKKSLLAVFGLAPATGRAPAGPAATPCENCAFSPCGYRRAPYRYDPSVASTGAAATRLAEPATGPLARAAAYSVNPRALRKWAAERVRLHWREDGTVEAVFRFDGTTCSNLGQPLAFDYRVSLGGPAGGYRIQAGSCVPAAGDEGYQSTCAYLTDPDKFMRDIAADQPLRGRPLDEVLSWSRASAPAGCHCAAASRAHKWGLALEAIHFALAQARSPQTVAQTHDPDRHDQTL